MLRVLWLQLLFISLLSINALAELGACTEADKENGINPTNQNFPKQLDRCATDSWGEEDKTTKCLKGQYPALSDGCAGCFGKLIACSTAHCKSKCLFDHFSNGCLDCVDKKCRDNTKENSFSLIACTGLEKDQLPPVKPKASL